MDLSPNYSFSAFVGLSLVITPIYHIIVLFKKRTQFHVCFVKEDDYLKCASNDD